MFAFGEKVSGYDGLMFNEREVRAAAGIVFLFAFMAFMLAWSGKGFKATEIMVSVFLFDFFIRIFVNPKYAPSMVAGRWIVNNQKPEYTDAAPKRWAWSIGFLIAVIVFYKVVLDDTRGPGLILPCALCLGLLFFEAVFGICAGCKIYNFFHKDKVKNCPGGTCDLTRGRESIQNLDLAQKIIFSLSILTLSYLAFSDIISALIKG